MDSRQKMNGFTLLELIVTIAVAAIILGYGVPGFYSFIQNNRATTHTNDLVTALNLARSEATRRGVGVAVCSSTDAAACNGTTDWSSGWIVRTTADVLRVWPERSGGANVVTTTVDSITFQPRGSVTGGTPTFAIRLPDCTGDQGRDVTVNAAGRIAVDRVTCP